MPIYAYRCAACGHSRDVLQKISDPVLHICPVCGADQFQKQVTAAGFQLKGSGWYVTDFKGGNAPATAVAPAGGEAGGTAAPAPAASSSSDGGSSSTSDSGKAASPASAPAPAPAPSSGSSGGGSAA